MNILNGLLFFIYLQASENIEIVKVKQIMAIVTTRSVSSLFFHPISKRFMRVTILIRSIVPLEKRRTE